jgi:hypothetical protein
MKIEAVAYWICTILIALSFLSGGVVDSLRPSFALEGMTHLGYPAYFMVILGFWKVLGEAAILVPGFALLKEWAYAGMNLRPDRSLGFARRLRRWCVSHPDPAGAGGVGRRVVGASPRGPQAEADLNNRAGASPPFDLWLLVGCLG